MTNSEFESIIHKHQTMVYSIALHFFRNAAAAEEIAQDVFLQLYQEKDSKSDLHTTSWLRRTTAHRCIDRLRRRKVQCEIQMDEVPDIGDSPRESDPLLKQRLWRLIASLPEKQRMIVILRFGEDMDVDEIAQTLQMPARTVWSHLQRAIALLREKADGYLRKEDYEPIGK
jgi:RNA polymerase sigma-70 factor (ECF subfamily)